MQKKTCQKLEIQGLCELTGGSRGSWDEEVGLKGNNSQIVTSEFLVRLGLGRSMVLVGGPAQCWQGSVKCQERDLIMLCVST